MRLRAQVPAEKLVFVGLDDVHPRRPASSRRSRDADVVVLPPSNPVVSRRHDPRRPGVREAPCARPVRPVVGLSPIVGGTHVRGMAEQMLTSIGVEVSAAGVAGHYGARSAGGILDGWLVDETDAAPGRRASRRSASRAAPYP